MSIAKECTKTLSIRMLKEGVSPDQVFYDKYSARGSDSLIRFNSSLFDIHNIIGYVGKIYESQPDWELFVRNLLGAAQLKNSNLRSCGAGAILFFSIKGRIVALCMGFIHMALNDDMFEKQFGLKVVLNSVSKDSLRTLDTATPDAVTFQRRVQASKESNFQSFGVDVFRDLARVAGGKPTNAAFAKSLAGKDSLSITVKMKEEDLYKKLEEIVDVYDSQIYKNDFGWIDNMQLIEDHNTNSVLNNFLIENIRTLIKGGASCLHLSLPEIATAEEFLSIQALHYNGINKVEKREKFCEISICDYIKKLTECCDITLDIDAIKKHYISIKFAGGDHFSKQYRIYDCMNLEVEINDEEIASGSYVLFSGHWYHIDDSYKKHVESIYNSVDKVNIIGRTHSLNEQALIDELERERHADLVKLDQTKINPNGVVYANLEPCDFFSMNKEFIHLKDGHSSAPISHLWMQGVVSAEAFVSDKSFRSKLKNCVKIKSNGRGFEHLLPSGREKVNRDEFKVVYGIMRDAYTNGTIDIPFFSKVSFQSAIDKLNKLNISVAIELIEKTNTAQRCDND